MLGCCRSVSDVAPRSKSSSSRTAYGKSLRGEGSARNFGGFDGSFEGHIPPRRSGKSLVEEPGFGYTNQVEELIENFQSHNLGGSRRKMGGKCPPPVKVSEDDEDYKEQCRESAEAALQYYNGEIAPYCGGIIYEMVDWGMSTGFFKPMEPGSKCHCNFTAKPLNSNGPPMLFFAEVWHAIHPDNTVAVLKCQILGPQGHVFTGHNGCRACSPDFGEPIHHPLDGDFDVGSAPCFLSSSFL